MSYQYKIISSTPDQVRLELRSSLIPMNSAIFAFVFDNTKGAIRAIQDKNETGDAWIPYSDVKGFTVVYKISSGSKSSHYYQVVMNLKSLGSYPLFQASTRQGAQDELDQFLTTVRLQNPEKFVPKTAPPSAPVVVSKENNKTVLRWVNPVHGGNIIRLAFFGALAAIVIAIITRIAAQDSVGGLIIMIVIIGVYCKVMYSQVTTLLKDRVTRYGFAFDSKEIAYFEERLSTGERILTTVIPKTEYFGLSYPMHSASIELIFVMTTDIAVSYSTAFATANGVKEEVAASKLLARCPALRIKNMHQVQRLSLVNWVRDEMATTTI